MLTAVEGKYKNGTIELDEQPDNIQESRVVVTFLSSNDREGEETPAKGQMMRKGMFPGLLALTEEDFKAAEFHGDSDDGLDWSDL